MLDYQIFFQAAPDPYIALRTDQAFTVAAVNDAYLRATQSRREDVVGRSWFDAFSDRELIASVTAEPGMRDSLQSVIATRAAHAVSPTIPAPSVSPAPAGSHPSRQWRALHTPIISADGSVTAILQRLEDVSPSTSPENGIPHQRETEDLVKVRDERETNRLQLQKTEAQLALAGHGGEIATWIWEPQSDRLFADVNLARWFHVPPDEARGGSITAFLHAVHPDDAGAVRQAIEHSLLHGSTFEAEYRISRDGGGWRWVVTRARVERDAKKQATRLVGVVVDITTLRETCEALRETQERLHLAAEAAEIGCFSVALPSGPIIADNQCREHFWLPHDKPMTLDVLGQTLHRDDREPACASVAQSIGEHKPVDVECRTVSAAGKVRWIHGKGRAYYDRAGRATRFDGITIDTTQRKQIEADLRGSEARYRLLVESLHDYAIIMQDGEGRVTSWNIGAERMLGYSEDEIIGRSARIFFTPEDQARDVDKKEIETAKKTGRANDDRWHVRKGGSRFFVSGMMFALRDDAGRQIGLAKIMRDITDRQVAAVERERLLGSERAARAEVERTSRLKDEFLATLSHELRTPLNAILGWTQVLKEGPLDAEELAEGLDVIDRNTRLQAELIEDLLDMSRIVSGKIRLEFATVDFAAMVQSAIASVRTTAEAKAIVIQFNSPSDSTALTGDGHRLQQIVLNLLSNAIKFTAANGVIDVVVDGTPSTVELKVADTGIGIRREFLPHIFERFRQADASTTRQHGGLGLGLSIVKQLVELHGGTVKAHSEGPGRGARFHVSLPRVPSNLPQAETPRATPKPIPSLRRNVDLTGVKVLVVDDEPDSAGLVKRVLEGCHANVQSAGSMHEALEVFRAFRPDILMSDIGMPQHDGYELIRRVRELPGGENVPAAALTALARNEDVDRAMHAGFQTHLAKPVEPGELVTMAAKLAGIAPDAVGSPSSESEKPGG